jgi:hypothetical protein
MNPKASCGVLNPPLRGIISNILWWLLDNSAKKTSMRFASEVLASLQLTDITALRL